MIQRISHNNFHGKLVLHVFIYRIIISAHTHTQGALLTYTRWDQTS
jgi:hypothetical protein